jgi:hypothetical protein
VLAGDALFRPFDRDGIVRIGELDGDLDALERQSEDFSLVGQRAV